MLDSPNQQNRLIQGDCIQELKSLASDSVDFILTDPPYGNDTVYGTTKRTIKGDESPLLGLFAVEACYRILKKNKTLVCFMEMKHQWLFDTFIRRYTDYKIRDYVIWNKKYIGMGYGFRKQYELMMVLEKGTAKYENHGFPNLITVAREPTPYHPHTKPDPLLEKLIGHCSQPGDLVLDPFMGSGSTGVTCKRMGRAFIGIELDEGHFNTSVQRIGEA